MVVFLLIFVVGVANDAVLLLMVLLVVVGGSGCVVIVVLYAGVRSLLLTLRWPIDHILGSGQEAPGCP